MREHGGPSFYSLAFLSIYICVIPLAGTIPLLVLLMSLTQILGGG